MAAETQEVPLEPVVSTTTTPGASLNIQAPTAGPQAGFFSTSEGRAARAMYLKIFVGGCFTLVLLIFGILSIFWGSLWKFRPSSAWMDRRLRWRGDWADCDSALSAASTAAPITWSIVQASEFPGGSVAVGAAVLEEHAWVAVTINAGSSARLAQSLQTPNTTYAGTDALTFYGVEARNENAYRNIALPVATSLLNTISKQFAIHVAQQAANASNLPTLLARSPQTITAPISYNIVNLAPFNIPVATAVTLVGLIYQVILSFFVVMTGQGARDASGLTRKLSTRTLIILRLTSSFVAYFFISLFYCLLSLAFNLDFTRKFGHSGFLVFWMLNYAGMLALGLALESLITLLTPRFIPLFMLTWIIINVSVCVFPIDVLPIFYRYGYAMPFYNLTRAMRTIIFGTRNRVGFNFGILLIWVAISVFTLPVIQWYVRRYRPAPDIAPPNQGDAVVIEKKSSA
ncbi:hypothetical protein BJ912DRAFT_1062709 [Pholiota molesta]|nr:hypothetical protein BJ912DRAFT_1062709 [Pholiota molesta]